MAITYPLRHAFVSPWSALQQELDAWGEAGRTARFWWRDDDATRPGPALERLLEIRNGSPLSIAAIPADVCDGLADRFEREAGVDVIQHGYSHRNFAPAGALKSEFPPGGPREAALRRLGEGRRRLAALFGPRFLPVLAPPWNRIDPLLARRLGRNGWQAVSGFRNAAGPGWINTHLDPIDWRGDRGFLGEAAALGILVSHLRNLRRNAGNFGPPSGLLTHHRDNDTAAWRFIEMLVERIRDHPAACWISIRDVRQSAES